MDLHYEEDGRPVPIQEFSYAEIDREEIDAEELASLTPKEMDAALKVLERILSWIWQNGMKNPEGLQIRAMIACWIFLKHLSAMELSELARGFKKKKQSIGRWHDQFKRDFPFIKTPHMKPIRAAK